MSQPRPKRKATINKSYNDAIESSHDFDLSASSSVSSINSTTTTSTRRRNLKRSSPQTENGNNSHGTPTPSKHAPTKSIIPYNWQPPPHSNDAFSHRLDLTDAYIDLDLQTLYCPNQFKDSEDGNSRKKKSKQIFTLSKGQYIYMISEPPGEPYYIGRIMGFKRKKVDTGNHEAATNGNSVESGIVPAQDFAFQIQWFYRPRDISKLTSDSRLLFASMHTDSCPLPSFRGLVTVKHKQDIEDEYLESMNGKKNSRNTKSASPSSMTSLELYTQEPNCFYFDKLFDRYMIKFYDVLSTNNLLQYANTDTKCGNYLQALNKRFEFIFVETQRTKSLINTFSSTSRNCEVCGQWCGSSQDSISCVECENYYHMLCLDPPLLKKPSRGFSWSCAACTKKHEIEYHSKKMLMLSHDNKSSNESQLTHELNALSSVDADNMSVSANVSSQEDEEQTRPISTTPSLSTPSLPKYETMAIDFLHKDRNNTIEQRRLKEEWCMRYLGMYARLEDGVDLDDRSPYPRASTRLGSKHQATNIPECDEDHPIVYYDVERTPPKKKPGPPAKNKKNMAKHNVDELELKKLEIPAEYADVDPRDYPSWLQPRPKGYIERGIDDGEGETCTLLWKSSQEDVDDDFVKLDAYVEKCNPIAEGLDLSPNSPNFVDAILLLYMKYNGDSEKAFEEAKKLNKKTLKEPVFTKEEIKKFEAGVKLFGSELHPVYKKNQIVALCYRCARLWRRYAVVWEDPLEIQRKTSKSTGWKKKVEWELLRDANAIIDHAETNNSSLAYDGFEQEETTVQAAKVEKPKSESPKKKRSFSPAVANANNKVKRQAKAVVKVKTEEIAPIIPENKRKLPEAVIKPEDIKKQKKQLSLADSIFNPVFNPSYKLPPIDFKDKKSHPTLTHELIQEIVQDFRKKQLVDLTSLLHNLQIPSFASIVPPFEPQDRKCCVCREHDTLKSSLLEMLICSSCGVNVHSSCAGVSIPENVPRPVREWLCDRCINDLRPVHSTVYSCALCLANESNYELSLMGSPYVRPDYLKSTDTGKWCHLLCAVFNHDLVSFRQVAAPQVKAGSDSKSVVEGVNSLISVENISRVYLENHKTQCGICNTRNGSMIKCDLCPDEVKYHITCAQDSPNFKLGFKLASKSLSERDVQLVTAEGKVGKLQPILICPRHDQSKSTILNMRTLGRRVHGKDELKPLMQMFLEDIVRVNSNRQYGPNSRSLNYITNFQMYHNHEFKDSHEVADDLHHTCVDCKTMTSPIWWPTEGNVKCQSCHHKTEVAQEEGPRLVEVLSRPLNGENYGIVDQYDKVSVIYQPEIPEEKPVPKMMHPVESVRSKISLGDILS
ncbi:uncharacterized protein SPAPADRAFT_147327 [Spathaspora passalidarum NRRL Y-27907]|uniref:Uncharacterized protein n=1 Tax=Spathaspora passalidarum (strain NRRL Y-27907 / 11-Y1) TaxID=619300 RepID=G3AEF4_SPAPN|nr:uncharacterized protein SPAPADRAFT_147327 [Spathaspora passalidarum NRRL Y-27907]EGW35742.1 hypothetical protein SPAPADRAFT_147327 [Spathaspora passalidarum NRRL Y-27907]